MKKAREEGRFRGAGLTTDESTPNSNKYCGLRFQVTWVHFLLFEDVSSWESPSYEAAFPFKRRAALCDLSHVPLKTGAETLRIIERQIGRLGLSRFDLVSGTGDGGGENEGSSGIHALLESSGGPSYVRRRCFAHLPWRVADAGIASMPHRGDTDAICVYLRDGVTWPRLRAIATTSRAQGGLGLLRETSGAARDVFGRAPPSIIEDRPETTALFILWLLPRRSLPIVVDGISRLTTGPPHNSNSGRSSQTDHRSPHHHHQLKPGGAAQVVGLAD